jgi:indole-3-glycerol phosphate synthase
LPNHLGELSRLAKQRVHNGYYDTDVTVQRRHESLVQAIRNSRKTPMITEIKYASPSSGKIRDFESPLKIAKGMLAGGACALSILTDPDAFQGGLQVLSEVAENVDAPIVMKDIIVSPEQLRAAANCGADAVVLISELFSSGLASLGMSSLIHEARQLGLEVLAEANGPREFEKMRSYKPDLLGINNRDLSTFRVDLGTTTRILAEIKPIVAPVVSESGIETVTDIRRLKRAGAQAFLVGTSIMKSSNIEQKVRELVNS